MVNTKKQYRKKNRRLTWLQKNQREQRRHERITTSLERLASSFERFVATTERSARNHEKVQREAIAGAKRMLNHILNPKPIKFPAPRLQSRKVRTVVDRLSR